MSNEKAWEYMWSPEANERLQQTQRAYDHAKNNALLNNMMGQGGNAGAMGQNYGGLVGGGHAGILGQGGLYQLPAMAPEGSKEDMIRDLLARATKQAVAPMWHANAVTVDQHRALVKELLQDFEDGASYIQAQMNMVESAYKEKPELLRRLMRALSTAYHSLVQSTFGD